MTFERKKKKDIAKGKGVSHYQFLSELAEKNLYKEIEKEEIKQGKKKIGKSYMINKMLEEL